MGLIGQKSGNSFAEDLCRWSGIDDELLDYKFKPKFGAKLVSENYHGIWRYKDYLPIENINNVLTLNEGFTPLLVQEINKTKVFIKQDQLFLTGSYKDRGAAILINKCKELGITHVVQDSSGNAGASVATYCALLKINCDIYLPKETPTSKIAQIKASGAKINIVDGDRDYTAKVAFAAAKNSYYASHCYNPYFFEGTKTFLFEVFEQLNFKMPEVIVLPAGNGTLLLGCYIGAMQLIEAGIADKMPRLIAIQSANCNPLDKAVNKNINTYSSSIAEGIAIQNPVRLNQMVEAVENTNGLVISVTETEIIDTWLKLGKMGFMVEPTSAATIAGLDIFTKNYVTKGPVVSLFSGSGLKATDKWVKYLNL